LIWWFLNQSELVFMPSSLRTVQKCSRQYPLYRISYGRLSFFFDKNWLHADLHNFWPKYPIFKFLSDFDRARSALFRIFRLRASRVPLKSRNSTIKMVYFSFFFCAQSNRNTVPLETGSLTAHSVCDCALFSLSKSVLLPFFAYRYDEIWFFKVRIPHLVSLPSSVRYHTASRQKNQTSRREVCGRPVFFPYGLHGWLALLACCFNLL